jgi:hypothetical protein
MRTAAILSVFTVAATVLGCGSNDTLTRGEFAPKMYPAHTHTILALPAVNRSEEPTAATFVFSSLVDPLTNIGYYVYPPHAVAAMMHHYGIDDSLAQRDSTRAFIRDVIGADAILTTEIAKWEGSFFLQSGSVKITLALTLRSTRNADTLWSFAGTIGVEESGPGSLGGLLAAAIVTLASPPGQERYLPLVRTATESLLQSMPHGPYDLNYGKDQEATFKMGHAEEWRQHARKK